MRVVRTVVPKSEKLPKKTFKTFVELEGMYHEMLLQTTLFAVQNEKLGWLRWNSLPLIQSDSGLYAMKR